MRRPDSDNLEAPECKADRTRRLLSSKEAANYLGISSRKLWELGNRGMLPIVRIDRAVRFDVKDLDAAIEAWRKTGRL